MSKVFGLILMVVTLYIGMTLYTKGFEQAYSDVFAPIGPSEGASPVATHLTPAAGMATAPSERRRRVRVTDAVRERVSADLEEGARRRGY